MKHGTWKRILRNFPMGTQVKVPCEIAGIMLRNRYWPTTFHTNTTKMLMDSVKNWPVWSALKRFLFHTWTTQGFSQPDRCGPAQDGRLGCTKKAMLRRATNVPGHLRSRAGYLRSRAGHPRCPGFIEKKAICPFLSSFIHENPWYIYLRQSASVSNRTL
jgi:hypothetical protein